MVNLQQLQNDSEQPFTLPGQSKTNHLAGCSEAITPPNYLVENDTFHQPTYGLESLGMKNLGRVFHNLSVPQLVEQALARKEGVLAANGALVVETGKYTGRSPNDKFIVKEPSSEHEIDWNKDNVPISEAKFEQLYRKVITYVQGRDLYIFDGYVGADPKYRFGVRIINELAYQNLFAHQLFLRPSPMELISHKADFTVICVPGLHGDPIDDGINSEAFIILHLAKKLVIIGGSRYSGEIKKSVFSMMNYLMTKQNVLPMHGAANIDKKSHTALFFGLSGTGKTTLSADPKRSLIGDDEHGWSDDGVFNFEGGCYAKTIRLSAEFEPQIWAAIRFGTLLENVIIEPDTRIPNYDDNHLTENTRAAYPLRYISNCAVSGLGSHPKTIFFLTADAFGVLPPIAKLTNEQAMYHFLSGYTSKLAGTERGITAPQVTFSACFGQCFFPLSPVIYAKMLGERLEHHTETSVFLINTGWSGGRYGVGSRISIKHTRAMVSAALDGHLDTVEYTPHPIFKVLVPHHVHGVPNKILDPRNTWEDPEAYDLQAQELARRFAENFEQFKDVPEDILAASPVVK
ncbi:Phosphoenolpyruvate carboxykinase (ATP) [Gloeothece citriformis PCC 7424]|uniref:Phosphoenolpyruvate carboxykinase (ATP) n=1 Tax=Gloeothece citriformis (strain PCC 7424) TaxID=65393 RepID=B7K8I8_GLOC7|nr:phosphoenolpyruvate carboxykinase (ATP) [Gloeothece citriformis]ACK71186.1 Phosphoenolpyruvate carboxykinase (ATP) [Gloeothece citriformis PCC 7424]